MAFPALNDDENQRLIAAQQQQARAGVYGAVDPNAQTTSTPLTSTRVATEARGADQSGNAVYRGGNPQQGRQPTGGDQRRSGSGAAAQSSQYSMPFRSSNEWFGQLDEYGGLAAAQSPGLMFDLYGTEQLGLNAGSATGQFYGQNYNPYAMGRALGQDLNSPDAALAAGTWMAKQLGQPGMSFFDPGQIVTSALSQLAQAGNGGAASSEFNFMQSLVAAGTTPDQQLSAVLDFLGEALKGAMTPDVLGAYMQWLQTIGMEIVNSVMTSKAQGGGLAEFERNGGNIATALLQRIGPNGGL